MWTLQALFHKLTSIQHTTAELLSGRERVVVVLLMRLTETLIIWLSEDQEFWNVIEDGENSLGPIGLQQVRSCVAHLCTNSFCDILKMTYIRVVIDLILVG